MRTKRTLVLAGILLACGTIPVLGSEKLNPAAALEGRWERTIPGSNPARKEVLIIDGEKETFSVEDPDDKVIRQMTSRIRLEKEGDVGIYTRFDIKVIVGDPPTDPLPKEQSFVYRCHKGPFHEVSGLLYDRTGSRQETAHVVWTQPGVAPQAGPVVRRLAPPPEAPVDPETKRDQELLQGRWERITRDATGKTVLSQEKIIKGNEQTLTNRDSEGKIVRQHTTKFRLENYGPVRVYHGYEVTVHVGDGAGRTFPTDISFVYRVDKKSFLDAPGWFQRRSSYLPDPSLFIWVRPEAAGEGAQKDNEAEPSSCSSDLTMTRAR